MVGGIMHHPDLRGRTVKKYCEFSSPLLATHTHLAYTRNCPLGRAFCSKASTNHVKPSYTHHTSVLFTPRKSRILCLSHWKLVNC